jgi:four helix bundle protein
MGNFEELKVWQRSKKLAVFLYQISGQGVFSKDYDLRGQIRRAAVSIPSNIAEGDELGTDRQAIKFFYIAKGSSAELFTQAIIAHEIGYLETQQFDHIKNECRGISGMLTRLIQARSKNTEHPAQ